MKPAEVTAALLPQRRVLVAFYTAVTQDYHLAEDIFQDVCIKAVGCTDKFETPKYITNWAKVVGRNIAIDRLRSRGERYVGFSESILELLASEWPQTKKNDSMQQALSKCIKKATPYNQELLRLRYFEHLPGAKVAEKLGRKLETVYQALARVHKALGTCVKNEMSEVNK